VCTVVPDLYKKALQESLRLVPYNSAVQFQRYLSDTKPDPRLGMACVFQTFDVAERAIALGAAAEPTFLREGRHVAAVFREGRSLIVLDPYLLHTHPLLFDLDAASETGVLTCSSEAAPVRQDATGQRKPAMLTGNLKLRGDDGYTLALEYKKYSPTKDHYVLSRYFKLDSTHTTSPDLAEFDLDKDLTHPEQTSLSIRTLSDDLTTMGEVVLPLRGWQQGPFTRERLWARNNQGVSFPATSEQARTVWDHVCESTGLDRETIEQHLLEASELYRKHADPTVDLATYNLDPE
jgi:hypothetical protein